MKFVSFMFLGMALSLTTFAKEKGLLLKMTSGPGAAIKVDPTSFAWMSCEVFRDKIVVTNSNGLGSAKIKEKTVSVDIESLLLPLIEGASENEMVDTSTQQSHMTETFNAIQHFAPRPGEINIGLAYEEIPLARVGFRSELNPAPGAMAMVDFLRSNCQ